MNRAVERLELIEHEPIPRWRAACEQPESSFVLPHTPSRELQSQASAILSLRNCFVTLAVFLVRMWAAERQHAHPGRRIFFFLQISKMSARAVVVALIVMVLVTVFARVYRLSSSSCTSKKALHFPRQETLRQWLQNRSIKEEVALAKIQKMPELHEACVGPIKPNANWLLDIEPSRIHTVSKPAVRDVVYFSEPFVYTANNYSFLKDGVPIERTKFAKNVLWPIYRRDKRINILFCITATMYENKEGGYKSDINDKGWDPEHTDFQQVLAATKEGVGMTAKTYAKNTANLKNIFTLPRYARGAKQASQRELFEELRKHGYSCKIHPMHLNAGKEWENPYDVPAATIGRFKSAFRREMERTRTECELSEEETTIDVVEPGFKDAAFWHEYMVQRGINIVLLAGGQTHWLIRQLDEHGLAAYLHSDKGKRLIMSGWSAGIIACGTSTAVAAYKCHYHDLQYSSCDFIRPGEPKAGRGEYCLPMPYEVGLKRDKEGNLVRDASGKVIHENYSTQEETLDFCKLDGIGAMPTIVFPHLPNKNDPNMNILKDIFPVVSTHALGVVTNDKIVRFDNGDPYFGEVMLLADGEAGAIGPLFEGHLKFPKQDELAANKARDLSIARSSNQRSRINEFYAKVDSVRKLNQAQTSNVQKTVDLLTRIKTMDFGD